MFRYLNLNPKNIKTGDCVIRAIACALDISWDEASDLLYHNAKKCYCEMSEFTCYSRMLDNMPFLERISVSSNELVSDFINNHKYGTFLVRMDGHLTCVKNGYIYDIWNCSNEEITAVWEIIN